MTTLGGSTRLVGLLGDPVAGSLSPRMHNAAFGARGLDWAYVALPVEARRLERAIRGLPALGFAGGNVTAPHKVAALSYCDEIDEVSQRAGSVNTLVVRDGLVVGASTDGLAVTESVPAPASPALVLGAGGAAQAVATALADAGAPSITIAARRPERAAALAARLRALGGRALAAESWPPSPGSARLVVNATPVRDDVVVDVRRDQTVVDLAYRADDGPTALVAAARERGCGVVVDGLEVLVRQGAASFERWTGLPAPVEVMRAAVRSAP